MGGIKGISNELLYESIMGGIKGHLLRNIIESGKPLPNSMLKYIIKRVRMDNIHLIAFNEYVDLYNALQSYSPLFMNRFKQSYQHYYDVVEKSFSDFLDNTPVDDYAPGFNSPSVRKTQTHIILDEIGGRDAMTGDLVRDPRTRRLLTKVIRHHFKISNTYNKMDCRTSALVPLTDTSHGAAHTALWERRFTTLKWFTDRGIPYIPSWWSRQNQRDYAVYLRGLGYNI